MQINAKIDSRGLLLKLQKGHKKLAFAVAGGINDAAKQIQLETREKAAQEFTLRGQKGEFIKRMAAVIKPFANAKQGRPFAELSVGRRDRLLLSQFDKGGERKPFVGKKVAVPITGSPARPVFGASVPAALRIKALRLRPDKRRPDRLIGLERTYSVPGIGIFKRMGPGPLNSKLIYAFDSDVELPRRIGFTSLWRKRGEALLDDKIDDRIKKELLRK